MSNWIFMLDHVAEDGTLQPTEDGWYEARCICGWTLGPLPGPEEVLDSLMEHAQE